MLYSDFYFHILKVKIKGTIIKLKLLEKKKKQQVYKGKYACFVLTLMY